MKNSYVRIITFSMINLILSIGMLIGTQALLSLVGFKGELYNDPLYTFVISFIISVGITGFIIYFFRKVDRQPVRKLGLSLDLKGMIFSIIVSVLVFGISYIWLKVSGATYTLTPSYFSDLNNYWIILLFVGSWFFAAFLEELANRSYFFANLQSKGPIPLLVVSSLIFMVMHWPQGISLSNSLDQFFTALCFMFVYMKSRSVWVTTIIHAAVNFSIHFFYTPKSFSVIQLIQEPAEIYQFYWAFSWMGMIMIMTMLFYHGKSRTSVEISDRTGFNN